MPPPWLWAATLSEDQEASKFPCTYRCWILAQRLPPAKCMDCLRNIGNWGPETHVII